MGMSQSAAAQFPPPLLCDSCHCEQKNAQIDEFTRNNVYELIMESRFFFTHSQSCARIRDSNQGRRRGSQRQAGGMKFVHETKKSLH